MWFVYTMVTVFFWSGSDLFSKMGSAPQDKNSHWKMVIVDGEFGYAGSANFTGAGIGAKGAGRRNLELGAVGREPEFVAMLEREFDSFWMGDHCEGCGRRDICPDPIR